MTVKLMTVKLMTLMLVTVTLGGLLAPLLSAQSSVVLFEAERLLRAQRRVEAIRMLSEHARTAPQAEPQVFLLLSHAYRANGNPMMAMDACQEGERRYPDSAPIAKCIARLLLARNPSLRATERYLRIATKDPGDRDAEAHYLYAQWACTNHQDDVCIEQATIARDLSGENLATAMQLSTLLGIANNRKNDEEAAVAAFEKAFEANQQLQVFDYLTAFEYVLFLTERDRNQKAEAVNEFLLSKAPRFAPALMERAKLQARAGNLAESAASAEHALTHAGPDKVLEHNIRSHLARTYLALGEAEKAQQHQQNIP